MKSVALPSGHPDSQLTDELETTDPLERAEWLITAGGTAFMVLLVTALIALA